MSAAVWLAFIMHLEAGPFRNAYILGRPLQKCLSFEAGHLFLLYVLKVYMVFAGSLSRSGCILKLVPSNCMA
jgi:hypothetical protein